MPLHTIALNCTAAELILERGPLEHGDRFSGYVLAGPVHAYQLVRHFQGSGNRRVDSLSLPAEVRVKGTKNNPCVIFRHVPMEIRKVAAIVR